MTLQEALDELEANLKDNPSAATELALHTIQGFIDDFQRLLDRLDY